ncbi:hypothetical protein EF294_02250 [Gordonia oryzae]|uniref:Uncharacterized protein n=2 Tax=Gordonia oryzae TaxID=2487349 RepID=A0A3N4GSJ3_9ACTN|nr:hypothetical protein EF294_02250 [Gordonia oryzae]
MSLLRTADRAAVASSVRPRVQRRQQQRWAAQEAAAPAAPGPTPAGPAGDARSELMVSLTALRNAGVAAAEFAASSGRNVA